MRIVALEEHFIAPELLAAIDPQALGAAGLSVSGAERSRGLKERELVDLGAARIADMDAAGITLQILSVPAGAAEMLDGRPGIDLARAYNDKLARAVASQPQRFAGFAHLPMRSPEAAADEFERAIRDLGFHGALVSGVIGDRFLDHPSFEPVLARAVALAAPIYIHPALSVEPVRRAYYDGLPGKLSYQMAASAWGWHIETAVQVLRLALSGAFDRHPGLAIIVGHMGEALPFMLPRCEDKIAHEAEKFLRRTLTRTIMDHVWITTSGLFALAPFLCALHTFGADRILFSVDYPYSSNADGRAFLETIPVSPDDREKIAHGNADKLLRLTALQ